MKRKIVTAFMMAALGSSLVFTQAAMAADTTAKTETSDDADKDAADTENKEADDTEAADDEAKDEDLKTIGEKPEEDTEGVLSVKLKNLTGKVITGVAVKNEKDEEYPDNFLKEEDKFEADEERVLWFDPNAKDKVDEENKDAADDSKDATETEETKEDAKTEETADGEEKDENGKIAEHWDNLAALAEPNPSGHTQTDGTMEVTDLDKTEENRELVKNFLYDVMQGNNLDKTPDYFDGDAYVQHNSGIADGVSGLNAALGALAEQGISMVYDEVHMVLAQGNFVLAVSEGTFGGAPTSYYDLWRVENGKIAEHWDVMETIADQSTWQNQNGKF